MNLTWIDILLVLIVLASVAAGWRRGFILSFLDLVRWLGSWLAALMIYKPVAAWLSPLFGLDDTWSAPVAFVMILVAAGIAIQMLGRQLLTRIPKEAHERRANRAIGTLPGFINGIVFATLVSALLFAMPFSDSVSQTAQQSPAASRLVVYADELEHHLAPVFGAALRQTLNRLTTVEPGSTETIELPFRVDNSQPAPDLEEEMLNLVNQEREAAGLLPLKADPELTEVARAHSADMFSRGYFSHFTPEGNDPFDRMRAADVRFRVAGENLAIAPTLQIAHTGLMNSPGHRANILTARFGRVGIGIMTGGRRGLMVSQEFRD